MSDTSKNLLALCAFSALIFSACDSSTSPAAPDKQAVKADLQIMASKITRLSPPDSKRFKDEGSTESGALKRAASPCVQEGMTVETGFDTSAAGGLGTYEDTSYDYTAADKLICAEEDQVAYTIGKDHSKDAVMESWINSRMVVSFTLTNIFDYSFQLTGTGKVHYFSGYDLTIDAISIKGTIAGLSEYKLTLGLDDGKYSVSLTPAPGVDFMSDIEPAPGSVVMSGPIQAGGTTVGYFELLGDDSVVIRDASKAVVASH
jgi:hypothetical protein